MLATKRSSCSRPGKLPMLTLIPCDRGGQPLQFNAVLPEPIADACAQNAQMHQRLGYQPPWVSYLAVEAGCCRGGGAFVGAPAHGMVEIAYFTLGEFQHQGYATMTARLLVEIARSADPTLTLRAFTLPEQNASTKILARLGFALFGLAHDAEAGEVWEWRAPAVAPTDHRMSVAK